MCSRRFGWTVDFHKSILSIALKLYRMNTKREFKFFVFPLNPQSSKFICEAEVALVRWSTIFSMKNMFVRSSADSTCLWSCSDISGKRRPSGHSTLERLKSLQEACAAFHSSWLILLSFFGGSLQTRPLIIWSVI